MKTVIVVLGLFLAMNSFAAQPGSTVANKKIVTSFYTLAFVEHHPKEAAEKYIAQVFAEGNLVALHVHSRSDKTERGRAIVDIFRVEDGKIVEHWDVVQGLRAGFSRNKSKRS